MRVRIDLSGNRYCRMLVMELAGKTSAGASTWKCVCDCGTEKIVVGNDLLNSKVLSCGCLRDEKLRHNRTTHGLSSSKTYVCRRGMFSRCYKKTHKDYRYYGALGVKVCERWNSFEAFLEDMGEKPEGLTLDRIDPCGNYEPDNCRWATMKEQNNNRRKQVGKRN